MSTTLPYRPSRGDRLGIVIFMIAGCAIIVWSAVGSGIHLIEVIRGESITATIGLIDTSAEIQIGGSGDAVPMAIDSATVTADHLTGAAFATAVISTVFGFAVVTTIVICLLLLARNSLRGKIFSRGNTRLVVGAGMTALAGFGVSSVLDRMVGNEILLTLSGGSLDNIAVVTAEPLPFVLLAFAFGIVATAYTVGARMQRDQEGLV